MPTDTFMCVQMLDSEQDNMKPELLVFSTIYGINSNM